MSQSVPTRHPTLREQVIRGFTWIAGTKLVGQLFVWTTTIIVMRLLTPQDYGLMAMASIAISLASLFADLGVSTAIVQRQELSRIELKQLFGLSITVDLSLFILMLLIAPFIAAFFDEPRLTAIVRCVAIILLISPFIAIPDALLQRALKFKVRALVDVSAAIASSTFSLLLALHGFGVWALVSGAICLALVRAIVYAFVCADRFLPAFAFDTVARFVNYGGNVTAARICWFFYSQADMIIAGKMLGKDALGVYSVAMHISSLLAEKFSQGLAQVAFPAFAQAHRNNRTVNTYLLSAVRAVSFVVFPTMWGLSSIAPEVVHMFLGSKWSGAIFPLQILCLVMPLRLVTTIVCAMTDAIGRPDLTLKTNLTFLAVMPLAFLIGSWWGLYGIVLGWLVVFPVVTLFNIVRSSSALPELRLSIIAVMGKIFLNTLGMYVVVLLARSWIPAAMDVASRCGTLILAGIISYATLVAISDRKSVRNLLTIVRHKPEGGESTGAKKGIADR